MLDRVGPSQEPDQQWKGHKTLNHKPQQHCQKINSHAADYLPDLVATVNLLRENLCDYAEYTKRGELYYEQGDLHDHIKNGIDHIHQKDPRLFTHTRYEETGENGKEND